MKKEQQTGILVFRKGKHVVLGMMRELHWTTERGAKCSFTFASKIYRDSCRRVYGHGMCTAELYHMGEIKFTENFTV